MIALALPAIPAIQAIAVRVVLGVGYYAIAKFGYDAARNKLEARKNTPPVTKRRAVRTKS